MLTKEEAEKLIKIKGEVRGLGLRVDWDFVLREKGKEGLKKVEDKLAESGFPLKYKEIKPMDFYPVGFDVISLLAIKEIFNFNEKDMERMGRLVIKFSLFIKIFMKYFASLELVTKQVPRMWREHYTVGDLETPEFSKEKKYMVLRMKNFRIHPIYCNIHKGYFSKVAEMIVKAPVTCQETKCMFKGNLYHEFLITW